MNIPQGYKQTELGIIPEDWEVKPIGECLSIGNGCDYKDKPFGNIPVYGTGGVITYINDYLYDGQTICIGRKGTINKPLYYEGKIWTVDTLYYTYNFIDVDVKYIYYLLLTIDWMSLNEATGVPSLTSDRIRHILLALPPVAEQRAIAEALSDIDGLIAALDKKIAKKRLIKQGAMQQLLTGKKRLPGFSGPWMERKLGAISHIKTGSCNGDQAVDNGKYPFFVRSQKVYAIDSYSYDGEAILVPGEGGIGSIFHYINGKFDYHQRVYKISDFADNVCGKYIFFYMSRYFGEYALSLTVKATVDSLRLPTFEEFVICMPLNIEEQQAIATILNDMDKEIDDLEAQRDKYRLLKSGMMQKLLMGQIRLTKPLTNVVPLVPGDSAVREIPVDAHIWAGHIVNRLWQSKGWGRTKLQKSLHLVGCYAQLDLGEEYIRNTAGPDDQRLMNYIDRKFKQYRHVNIEKERLLDGKIHYSYTPTSRIQEVEMAYERYPQDIRERVDNLLDKLNLMNLAEAEILSTLYAVWNNRIIKEERITDDLLVSDFYAWSEHKADFEERKVRRMLDYMCKENIVPIGWGKYIDEK